MTDDELTAIEEYAKSLTNPIFAGEVQRLAEELRRVRAAFENHKKISIALVANAVAARTDVPALVAEVRRLRAEFVRLAEEWRVTAMQIHGDAASNAYEDCARDIEIALKTMT